LAAGELSESYGRAICQWTDRLPEKYREESGELLVTAAAAGLRLADLSALFAGVYERARSDLPDGDPARAFAGRGRARVTTLQGAGVAWASLFSGVSCGSPAVACQVGRCSAHRQYSDG